MLIGPPASGKSEIGAALARRLNRPFVDTDLIVEREAGRTIEEIFEAEGEQGFRARESSAVLRAAGIEGSVIACGGGAVLDPANVEALRAAGTIVYLKVRPDAAAARVGEGPGRPLLRGPDPAGRLASLIAEREPAYLAAADRVVDAAGPVEDVVRAILEEAGP